MESPDSVTPLDAAHTTLRLTDRRLALMEQVMASKWQRREPIEDLAQEQRVLAGALAQTRARGLTDGSALRFFAAQIDAAKEVELGWGERWLWSGCPPAPVTLDLTQLRAELAAFTPRFVTELIVLARQPCEPRARAQLLRDSRRLVPTPLLTDDRRAAVVDALLAVRPQPAPAASPRGSTREERHA